MLIKSLAKIQKLTLRRQIILYFCISIVMAILIQLFYSLYLYFQQRNIKTEESSRMIQQTDMELNRLVNRISQTGDTLSANVNVQKFLILQNRAASENLKQRRELRAILYDYFSGVAGANDYILDIALITPTKGITTLHNHFDFATYKILDIAHDINNQKGAFFSPWIKGRSGETNNIGFAYIIPVYYTTSTFSVSGQRLGTCIIWCSPDPLKQIVQSSAATKSSTVVITDSEKKILAYISKHSLNDLTKPIEQLTADFTQGQVEAIPTLKVLGERSSVLVKTNLQTGWNTINITPISEIYRDTLKLLYSGIALALLTIAMILSIGFLVIRSIMQPMAKITEALGQVGGNNRELRLEGIRDNEFGTIAASINDMLVNINSLNRKAFDVQTKLYETELIQKESELLALQSKIDPHFLNNTLECIRSIATIRKAKEISTITASMANIFRFSTKGDVFTRVDEELSCISDYTRIIDIRYNGRVKIAVEVDEELLPYSMLKMSLQPIIENAIYHGLDSIGTEICIRITGSIAGENAIFTVTDNGVGMSRKRLEEVRRLLSEAETDLAEHVNKKKVHIGLSNIHARIKLHYGKECGLFIKSEEKKETSVSMKIGLVKINEDKQAFYVEQD